ncbi:MAG: hypothetical protein JWM14_3370 [Chitinophagaceae bacterium]|nr:hypothetical protein [Chitinophagaceae bacterium]
MTYNFYFNEAGYKGTLQDKPKQADLALIAGLLIQDGSESKVLATLTEILKSTSQESKEKLVDYIKNESALTIFHAAIYCTAVYNDKSTLENLTSGTPKNVYHLPFTDVLMKVDEFIGKACEKLNFVTDQNNGSIQKESLIVSAKKSADNKTVLEDIDGMDLELDYIQTVAIEYKSSPLTLAANAITELIYHHVHKKVENGFDKGLNGNLIFEGFELADKIEYLDDQSMFDTLYPQSN